MTWLSDRVQVYIYVSWVRIQTSWFLQRPCDNSCKPISKNKCGRNLSTSFIRNTSYIQKRTSYRVYDNWPDLPSIYIFLVSTDSTVIIPGIYYSYVLYKIKIVIWKKNSSSYLLIFIKYRWLTTIVTTISMTIYIWYP